jgi:hypothetical protein
MMDFNADHFSLFGLPRSYRLDPLALDKRYREIQSRFIPIGSRRPGIASGGSPAVGDAGE